MYSVLNHVQCNILFDYAHERIALYFHYFMIARCFISILLDALLYYITLGHNFRWWIADTQTHIHIYTHCIEFLLLKVYLSIYIFVCVCVSRYEERPSDLHFIVLLPNH